MIKELPDSLKPRERLLSVGVENLSNEELIAIIIRTGVRNISVKDLSINILNKFKTIQDLYDVNVNYLKDIKGVGLIKAMTLVSAIELGKRVTNKKEVKRIKINNSKDIFDYYHELFYREKQEKLIAIYLDTKKWVIDYDVIFIGTVDRSVAHPREVFKKAILNNASGIILVHNHPSGDVTPSSEDINFTNIMIENGRLMGIYLIDHIILGKNNYYSFNDKGE